MLKLNVQCSSAAVTSTLYIYFMFMVMLSLSQDISVRQILTKILENAIFPTVHI